MESNDTQGPLIYKKIPRVMEAIGVIPKGQYNKAQNYNFRGIDDIYNIQSALIKEGVSILPEITDKISYERETVSHDGKKKVARFIEILCKFTFYAEDGSSVQAIAGGEAMDYGDKGMGKAMSTAFKYACSQVFCIPTEEMKDVESDNHELAKEKGQSRAPAKKAPPKAPPAANKPPDRDLLTADKLIAKVEAATALAHLDNIRSKYQADYVALSPEDQVKMRIARDKKKVELQEALKAKKDAEAAGQAGAPPQEGEAQAPENNSEEVKDEQSA